MSVNNSKKNKIKNTIKSIGDTTKREIDYTAKAAKIIKKIIKNKNATPDEVAFLKHHSIDILKILGIIGVSIVSSAIPVLLNKVLEPKGINIFPTEFKSKEDQDSDDTMQA